MQFTDAPESPVEVAVIGPSLPLELSWAVHSAWSPQLRSQHPILQEAADEYPAVFRGIREFWGDDLNAFCEFEVLAHSAGALEESDFDRLIDAIDSARPSAPRDLPLLSESADAREIINGRIAQLCDDAARWATYRTLLESLYGTLDGWWRAEGMPTAEKGVAAARRELARGGEWNRMVSADCSLVREHFPEILQRPVPVVLAVCALFGKGMYLDLPGCQLVGVGTGMGELGARARTEELARQLRVLAEPTRLAIVNHLMTGPRSIGDLALDFNLTQPTISVHVKQLRQTGFVTATRRGSSLELSVNAEAVRSVSQRISDLFDLPISPKPDLPTEAIFSTLSE
jgi:ArsR family transcriptional regulator